MSTMISDEMIGAIAKDIARRKLIINHKGEYMETYSVVYEELKKTNKKLSKIVGVVK